MSTQAQIWSRTPEVHKPCTKPSEPFYSSKDSESQLLPLSPCPQCPRSETPFPKRFVSALRAAHHSLSVPHGSLCTLLLGMVGIPPSVTWPCLPGSCGTPCGACTRYDSTLPCPFRAPSGKAPLPSRFSFLQEPPQLCLGLCARLNQPACSTVSTCPCASPGQHRD
jgi:hypothetical protein